MILSNYKEFVDEVLAKMEALGIDTSELEVDHLGYQASSMEDYETKKQELSEIAEIRHDVQVGEVRVAILEFKESIPYKSQTISAVEIVSPKEGKTPESSWEHIEIVPPVSLEDFMKKYPDIDWGTSALDRDIFPMLTLQLDETTRVKFPRRPVLVEVKRIKKNN